MLADPATRYAPPRWEMGSFPGMYGENAALVSSPLFPRAYTSDQDWSGSFSMLNSIVPLSGRRWDLLFPGGRITIELEWGEREPTWLGHAIGEIRKLLCLPDDWDSYGGRPVSPSSAVRALELLLSVMRDDAPPAQFVPARQGGIQLEWHTRGIDLEIEVQSTGRLLVLFVDQWYGEEWERDLTNNWAPIVEAVTKLSRSAR